MSPRPWIALAALAVAVPARAQTLVYPKTTKVTHVDDYFGTKVADPYRWLEDDTASAVRGWVQAENAVTFGYLNRIPFRARLRARLEELQNYPRYSAPSHTGPYYVFSKNDGLQNQSVLYIQRGKDGYGKREELKVPESDMFRAELDMFAESCRTGKPNELNARNGNVALAVVYAGLRSIDRQGQAVKIADVIADAHKKLAEESRHVA